MDLEFHLNNKLVPPPRNWKEIQIELLFTSVKPSASVQSIAFEWVGDNASAINTYIQQGLQGGVGIYEGMPLKIKACGTGLVIFDGMLDLVSESAVFECDIVKCPIKESGRIDFLNDIADSFTFAYLASPLVTGAAHISLTDYKKTPYTITTHRSAFEKIATTITVFMLAKELADSIREAGIVLTRLIKDAAELVPIVTQVGVLELIADIAEFILYLVYIAALMLALIKMIIDLIELIVPLPKWKYTMRVQDMFVKACAYLGYTFSSSIVGPGGIYENFTWMPQKTSIPSTSSPLVNFIMGGNEILSGRSYGYYDGTFKQFIVEMQDYFNASVTIKGGVFYFERVDHWNAVNPYALPNTGPVGYSYNYPEPHGTNASELPSNYLLIYAIDNEDLNTFQRYAGTSYQVQVKPNIINNQKNVLLKNLVEKRFRFSLAKRKDYLNEMEANFNSVLGVLGGVIGTTISNIVAVVNAAQTGNPPQLNQPLSIQNNRVGWMELASDFTTNPKVFIGRQSGTDWVIDASNQVLTSAQTIFESFHRCSMATTDPVTGKHGQYLTYKNKTIPLCCDDFNIVSNNNILQTADGKNGKFYRILWNLHQETAEVDYGINWKFTNNLTEHITIDGAN